MQKLINDIAVEIKNFIKLNRSRRMKNINNIRKICFNFIDIDLDANYSNKNYYEINSTSTVQIAHFFVQKYLKSERIRHQKTAIFNLNNVTTHVNIAQICLVYLLKHNFSSSNLAQNLIETFSLTQFVAMY